MEAQFVISPVRDPHWRISEDLSNLGHAISGRSPTGGVSARRHHVRGELGAVVSAVLLGGSDSCRLSMAQVPPRNARENYTQDPGDPIWSGRERTVISEGERDD